MKMIRKTFIVVFVGFIGYTIFVQFFAPDWWHSSQNQEQENIIKAQKFVYNDTDTFPKLILGSSLSCYLIMDSLPNTYNLSFGGHGICDGLHLLSFSKSRVGKLFIEMNMVLKPESEEFITSIISPFQFYEKKYFFSLREDKRPLDIMSTVILNRFLNPILRSSKNMISLPTSVKRTSSKTDLLEEVIKTQIDIYSKNPNNERIITSFRNLKKYVDLLEAEGVVVSFFEMPLNNRLNYLPLSNAIRTQFYRDFPPQKYKYINLPRNINFITRDGFHLKKDEASFYTHYFKQNM
jgi:hypothetical protein